MILPQFVVLKAFMGATSPILKYGYFLGGARVKYFNLPIGDINSPSYNKFTEGIDFFQQATQTLGRAL